jgi:hypothetical protein
MPRRPASIIALSVLLTATLLTLTVFSGHSVSASQNEEPIEIVSVVGPIGPPNPGGPGVKVTLRNVGVEPVISVTATLGVDTAFGTPVEFTFDDVTPAKPLRSNRSTSDTLIVIGGGFDSDESYPLTINATLQSGANYVYTKLVQIVQPRPTIWGLTLIAAMCALFPPYPVILSIPVIIFLYLSESAL